MNEMTLDEIIIHYVSENECLFNKKNAEYKNNKKKKDIWENIAANMKNIYCIDITANAIEKRWSSLRDQFTRENRKKRLLPSGSGYDSAKDWDLYKAMLFLLPHISHRRTTTSLHAASASTSQQYEEVIINESVIDTVCYEDASLAVNSLEVEEINSAATYESQFPFQPNNSSSASSSVTSTPSFKPTKKVTPELDTFAKRRKINEQLVDKELAEASSAISAAVNSMSTFITQQKEHGNGYMLAIEEGLKHVPNKNKTECLIEVLQVIKKFEERL